MPYHSFVFALCLLLLTPVLSAQSRYALGTLPNLNIGTVLADGWKLNSKVESRQIFLTGNDQGSETDIRFDRMDVAAVVSRKTAAGNSIGVGYLIRFADHRLAHRVIQQYAFSTGYGRSAIAHRISADQTFRSIASPVFRLRYRFGLEVPLNGQSIDPKELYLKFNNEYLGILEREDTDIEIRVTGALGISLNDDTKLETGIDYRVSEFFNEGTAHQIWVTIGGFFSL